MSRRRGKSVLLSPEEMRKVQHERVLRSRRKVYNERQRQTFFVAYKRLCKKYGCTVGLGCGGSIWKVSSTETIYKLASHLDSVERSLEYRLE